MYDGQTNKTYLDGILAASVLYSAANIQQSTLNFGAIDASSGLYYFTNVRMDDLRIYNRVLSNNEIRLLATRRGIAYEMAPRRRSSVLVSLNLNNLMMGSSF